jgi:hypothetical protein
MWSIYNAVVSTPQNDLNGLGDSTAHATCPAAPMARKVEVEVITVEAVGFGA